MNPSQPVSRPLGLTLLALANFLVGGLFGILTLMALGQLLSGAEATADLLTILVAGFVLALGAIVSGLGYLRLSALYGKTIGTVFGLLIVAYVALGLIMTGRTNIVHLLMVFIGLGNTSLVNTVYRDVFSEE